METNGTTLRDQIAELRRLAVERARLGARTVDLEYRIAAMERRADAAEAQS